MEFQLSAGNLIMGTFTFAFISLPEGWVIRRAESPPDIDYTTGSGETGWVLEGNVRYYIVNVVGGEIVELDVKCKRGLSWSPGRKEYSITRAGGHEAYFSVRSAKPGLLRKQELRLLNLAVPCAVTGRLVEFTFAGPGSWIDNILGSVGLYRCH